MPIYEYQCPKGHVTEIHALISESDDPIPCQKCKPTRGGALVLAERIISRTGAPILKRGKGGFYKPNA